MAKRPTPTPAAPETAATPAAEPVPVLDWVLNPISRMSISPRTRDEIDIRDAIRREFVALEGKVVDFVAAKQAEGWSLPDLQEMYALQVPLLFGYSNEHGRIRASYDIQLIEPAE